MDERKLQEKGKGDERQLERVLVGIEEGTGWVKKAKEPDEEIERG